MDATRRVVLTIFLGTAITCVPLFAQPAGAPARKKLLAIGDVRTGFQHDSVSHALATIERLGRETKLFDTYIRTDSQLLTKQQISVGPRKNVNARNLNYFDAVFYFGTGEGDLTPQQKVDLMSFVKEDGKGFVGAHTGDDAYFTWPEFGEMIGGYFDNHPWGVFDAPVIVEDPNFPAMKVFKPSFTIRDEIYQHKDFSRDKVHVLARLDASKLDLANKNVHRTDKDFPVAWAKMYGNGRVFYSTFGHTEESWDNPDVQKMYLEAIKWALRLTGEDIKQRSSGNEK
ncbi:MAG TPA: ThuA domain-containing protein [Bryobacteraceae bacterium]|nr:ThuA domain-containing protein [Bryobacteraceae bacterium]